MTDVGGPKWTGTNVFDIYLKGSFKVIKSSAQPFEL